MSVNDDLEGIVGISDRGREVGRGVLRSSSTFKAFCFVPTEKNLEHWSPVFYAPAAKYVFSRRLAHPRHIYTHQSVNFVTILIAWVGASNQRALSRVRGAVVAFVDR